MTVLGLTLEFGGGAELLVGKIKRHQVYKNPPFLSSVYINDVIN